MRKIILWWCLFLFSSSLYAEKLITLDLQNVNTQDALHIIAQSGNLNLIVSTRVMGSVNLHLHDVLATQALDLVLTAQGLSKHQQNNTWFIIPQDEMYQYAQAESKLQDMLVTAAPLTTRVWQIHYAKVDDLAAIIQDNKGSLLSKRGYLHSDARTNKLCVQDVPERLRAINQLIARTDIPVKQVMIEARLASVDSDFERELGINFAVQAANAVLDNAPTSYSLAVAKLADGSLLDVQLSALEANGHGELISSPSLFTDNQQTATIEAGEEIPYQEISKSGATGVAFKKAVLSLKVTPQILPGNKVLLQMQINQDKPNNRIVLGVPSITTRQISTNVLIPSGRTIVLGGIFESTKDDVSQGVPFFSKLPGVGLLFRQHAVAENKRELLIFVTPRIIDSSG